jgi:RNA polymerase sigma factor (sigma-70 family)
MARIVQAPMTIALASYAAALGGSTQSTLPASRLHYEEQLWLRFKKQGCQQSRQLLIESNDSLACSAYRRLAPTLPPHEVEDAIAEARKALVEAADRYDPEYRTPQGKPVRFSTYAYHHVQGKIRHFIVRDQRHRQREASFVPYEALLADSNPDQPTLGHREEPVIAHLELKRLIQRLQNDLRASEFLCFQVHFLRQGNVEQVQQALRLSNFQARSLIRRVRELVRPYMEAVGLTP